MIICRHCFGIWPDDAAYCGHCNRSFGGRRCPKGHLNPDSAVACIYCASTELTPSSKAFGTGRLSRLLAWGVAIAALRWLVVPNAGQILLSLAHLTNWLGGAVLGIQPGGLLLAVLSTLLPVLVLLGAIFTVAPPLRGPIRSALKGGTGLLRTSIGFLWTATRFLVRGLSRLVTGTQRNETKDNSDSE